MGDQVKSISDNRDGGMCPLKSLRTQNGWITVQEWEEGNKASDFMQSLGHVNECLDFVLEECGAAEEFKLQSVYLSDIMRYRFWEDLLGHIVGNKLEWGRDQTQD